MKVLVASITDSGVFRVRKEIITELIRQGHSITVVTPSGNDTHKLFDLGCHFIPIKINGHGTNPIQDLGVYCYFKKILKAEMPDIVLTFTPKPNVYCSIACRNLQIPVIMNITGLGTALANPGYKQKILLFLYRLATKNIYRIFFQNSYNLQFFKERNLGEEKSYWLLPGSGVNLSEYKYQEYPKSDNTINLLFIARIQKSKGIDQYLDAARSIRKTHPKVIFHVLGNCDATYEPIIAKAHKECIINYHGRVSNVLEFQAKSHATIMPSYYPEGVCNVLLEAAATGRPIITTNHPGCRETVDDGITGFIVEKKDSQGLIRAIETLLSMSNEERAEMGRKGRKKMERKFDRNIVVKAYVDSVNKLNE